MNLQALDKRQRKACGLIGFIVLCTGVVIFFTSFNLKRKRTVGTTASLTEGNARPAFNYSSTDAPVAPSIGDNPPRHEIIGPIQFCGIEPSEATSHVQVFVRELTSEIDSTATTIGIALVDAFNALRSDSCDSQIVGTNYLFVEDAYNVFTFEVDWLCGKRKLHALACRSNDLLRGVSISDLSERVSDILVDTSTDRPPVFVTYISLVSGLALAAKRTDSDPAPTAIATAPKMAPSAIASSQVTPTHLTLPATSSLLASSSSNTTQPDATSSEGDNGSSLSTQTIFCAIGDSPFTEMDRVTLLEQLKTIDEKCEFLIHLGNFKYASDDCNPAAYDRASNVLQHSPIPTFILLGENEWNDCPEDQTDIGLTLWRERFYRFDQNWRHNFQVEYREGQEENYHFILKNTLFIGLNLVGGTIRDEEEWNHHLVDTIEYTLETMHRKIPRKAAGTVLMFHARPSEQHRAYFHRFWRYLELNSTSTSAQNQYPILLLHSGGREFLYQPEFLNLPNVLKIQISDGTAELPLKIVANPFANGPRVEPSFQYERGEYPHRM